MPRRVFPRALLTLLSIGVCTGFVWQDHEPTGQKRILLISGIERGWAVHQLIEKTLRDELNRGVDTGVVIYNEYLDSVHFDRPAAFAALADFMNVKYAKQRPDLIITVAPQAYSFITEFGRQIMPGVPVVFVGDVASRQGDAHPAPHMTGVSDSLDLAATVDLALTLQPETENIYVVTGASGFDSDYANVARQQLTRFADRVTFHYVSGLSLEALLKLLGELNPADIVYYLSVTNDAVGRVFTPVQALDRIAAASAVPVYGWYDTMLEHGIVGARVWDTVHMAQLAAAMAIRVLQGTPPTSIPIVLVKPDRSVVDWRELKKRALDGGNVPQDATVLHRERSTWQRYHWYIITILIVTMTQLGFIVALLVQRVRRRRAELAVKQSEAQLRTSYEQIQDLARRLITAQEAERTRIARELHDDVNQQLAGLAIALSRLRQSLGSGTHTIVQEVEQLQRSTTTVVEAVRDLSHELHPGTLRHAGLLPALGGLCAEMRAQKGIRIDLHPDSNLESLPDDVALTLYRVAQEALHNVVRHADARQVRVSVQRTGGVVQLEVNDDGKGFIVKSESEGLGLLSMEERVRLAGGELRIDSGPGAGTRLLARVPASEPQSNG